MPRQTRRRGGKPPGVLRQLANRSLAARSLDDRVAQGHRILADLSRQYGLPAPQAVPNPLAQQAPVPNPVAPPQQRVAAIPGLPGISNAARAPAPAPAPPIGSPPFARTAPVPLPDPKFLAKGSYGCAYRPPLACDGETTVEPDTVSKLITPASAAEEMKFQAMLAPIDPTQDYFLYPKRSCDKTTTSTDAKLRAELQKCTPVAQYPKAKLLILPDGGTSLEKLPKSSQIGATLVAMRNLLVGLQKLHAGGYAHMDIKPDNIVLKDGKARYIDFGLSRKFGDPIPDPSLYHFNYPWWPFELRILAGEKPPFTTWEDFRNRSLQYQPESRDLFQWVANDARTFRPEIVAAMSNVYTQYTADKANLTRQLMIWTDTYGLGRTLQQVYFGLTGQSVTRLRLDPSGNGEVAHMLPDGRRVKPEKLDLTTGSQTYGDIVQHTRQKRLAGFTRTWCKWCEGMMDPDPTKRTSIDDALAFYDATIRPEITRFFSASGGRRRTRRKNSQRRDKWTRSSRVF